MKLLQKFDTTFLRHSVYMSLTAKGCSDQRSAWAQFFTRFQLGLACCYSGKIKPSPHGLLSRS